MARKTWAELSTSQRGLIVAAAIGQLALQTAALRDLRKRPADRIRGPKAAWAAASFVNIVGPLAYFTVGVERDR